MPRASCAGPTPRKPRARARCPAIQLLAWIAVGVLLVSWAKPVAAQANDFKLIDLSYARGYVSMAMGAGLPTTAYVDGLTVSAPGEHYDLVVGLDLGRHVGLEVTATYFEAELQDDGRRVAELTLATFAPRIRLRLPLERDRVVPWVAGGVGYATMMANDFVRPWGRDLYRTERDGLVGLSLAGGLDYFIAENLTVGVKVTHQRTRRDVQTRAGFASVPGGALNIAAALGVYFPERGRGSTFDGTRWRRGEASGPRPYVAMRFGARWYLAPSFAPGTVLDIRGGSEQTSSFAVGLEITPRIGVELGAEFHETSVWSSIKLAEYATWILAPEVRVRFPVLQDRLVPYLAGGVGLGWSQINDKEHQNSTDPSGPLRGGGTAAVVVLGLGGDLRIADNISLVFDARRIELSSAVSQAGREVDVDLSSLQITGGLKVYFR